MKYSIIKLMSLLVVLFPVSVAANEKKVDIKCYVEYKNGLDGIQFVYDKIKDRAAIEKVLTQSPMTVILTSEQAWISKVGECVGIDELFKLGRAQLLDRDTPR